MKIHDTYRKVVRYIYVCICYTAMKCFFFLMTYKALISTCGARALPPQAPSKKINGWEIFQGDKYQKNWGSQF